MALTKETSQAMRIEGSSKTLRTSRPARTGSTAGPANQAFAFAGSTGSAATAANVVGMAPLTSLTDLLAVQAGEDGTIRRRLAQKRGEDLLERLDEIRLALLEGRMSVDTLVRLRTTLSADRERSEDPALDAVIADIELRAEVEIAKLEQARKT